MNFAELLDNKLSESIVFRGKKLDVVFYPERVQREDWERFENKDLNAKEREEVIADVLAIAVDSWSLEDMKPTKETFLRPDFPASLFLAIFDRLIHLRNSASGKFKVLSN
jgi:hypothetical protein